MIKTIFQSTTKSVIIIGLFLFISACASSPEKERPEVIESAYKSLSAGVSHYNNSEYQLANNYFNTALNTFRSVDHREGIASSCLNIAKVNLEINNTSTAEEYLVIAEKIINESELTSLKGHLAIISSSLLINQKNYVKAKNLLKLHVNSKENAIKLAALQSSIKIAMIENNINTATSLTSVFAASITSNDSPIYRARLYRFEAELNEDQTSSSNKYKLALSIYRDNAHKPGIASTLQEWGDQLLTHGEYKKAENKLVRALFVRQSIQDEEECIQLLISLKNIYEQLQMNGKTNKTIRWINKLSVNNFNQWDKFTRAFNKYPAR